MKMQTKLKKVFSLFLALCMAVSIVVGMPIETHAAEATTGTLENGIKYSIENGEATVTLYRGSAGPVVIPSHIEGAPVTTIGEKAFYYCTGITSVQFPETLKTIGKWGFSGCKKLTHLDIPESVTSFGVYCFYDCQGLESITLPEGTNQIAGYMFSDCKALKSIVIPDSVTKIEYGAFYRCSSLETVTIPAGVTDIVRKGFAECTALKTVNFKGTQAQWESIVFGLENDILKTVNIVYNYTDHEHSYTASVTAPTCTNEGYTTYTCSCGDSYVSDTTAKIDHNWTVKEEKEATCTEDGCIVYTCSYGCGNEKTETTDKAHGHDYWLANFVSSTCTEQGYKEVICGYCRDSYIEYYNPILSHNYVNGVCTKCKTPEGQTHVHSYTQEVTAPTCTNEGYTRYTCVCTWSYFEDRVPALGHSYLYEVIAPTCLDRGFTYVSCENCSYYTFENYTDAIGHNYEAFETVAPNCTEEGYTTYKCANCNDTYKSDKVDAIGHNYEAFETVAPTCSAQGYTSYKCSRCSDTYKNYVDVVEHDFVKGEVIAPTQYESGYTVYECSYGCGMTEQRDFVGAWQYSFSAKGVKITGNTYPEGNLVSPSTIEYNDVIGISGRAFFHKDDLVSFVFNTNYTGATIGDSAFEGCTSLETFSLSNKVTQIGDSAFKDCTSLNKIYFEGTKEEWAAISIYPNGNDPLLHADIVFNGEEHSHDYTVTVFEATCTANGYTNYHCNTCGYDYTTNWTYAAPHEYTEEFIMPTCTEKGYYLNTCVNCGYSYKNRYEDAFGHAYVPQVYEVSCTEEGCTLYTCDVCGDFYKEDVVEALGHDTYDETTEPTCTEYGYVYTKCYRCDVIVEVTRLDIIEHNFVAGEVVAPQIGIEGYTVYTCTGCGATENRDFTPALPEIPTDRVNNVAIVPSDVGVTLSWDAFSGANEYYAKVYDKDFTKCLKTITTKELSAFFDYKLLAYNTEYKFIVTAKYSTNKYLTVANATKVDGAMEVGSRVVGHTVKMEGVGAVVDFLPVSGAQEYMVNVFENDANGTRIYNASLGTATSARVMTNLTAGTTYVVMINVKLGGKWTALADLRVNGIGVSFIAPVYNPSSVTIAAETATSVRFNWSNVRGATSYFIKVTEKATGKLVNTLKAEGKTTATLSRWTDGTRISPNTTYILQFYTYVNSVTNSGVYGDPIEITTVDFEPVTVTARYTQSSNKVTLYWNKTSNAVGYFVYTFKNGVKIANKYVDGANNTIYELSAPSDSGIYTYGIVAYEKNSSGTAYTPVSVSNEIVKI